jgi:hypothetical protein
MTQAAVATAIATSWRNFGCRVCPCHDLRSHTPASGRVRHSPLLALNARHARHAKSGPDIASIMLIPLAVDLKFELMDDLPCQFSFSCVTGAHNFDSLP